MTEHSKADDARKGLIDSVKGRAKEIVGAIIKNDSLTAEGQLEQAQARDLKEASTAETLADAETKEAGAELTNAKLDSVDARNRVDARIAAPKGAAETEQAARRAAARESVQAEADAQREVQQASAEEQAQVRAADEQVSDALDDHQAAVADAAKARAKADDLRVQAEDLPSDADRP